MIEIFNRDKNLIVTSDKKEIVFNTSNLEITLDWFEVSHPWEYEKSWILLEVKEYFNSLFYNFLIEWHHIVFVTSDHFELKEDILSFFWDVDVLIIIWTKQATKVFENIEAKIVIPYSEWKDLFLSTLWQHIEEVELFKIKGELPIDTTEFVNLK